MKIVASTMGKALEVFINMLELVENSIPVEKVGIYVSDSQFFKSFARRHTFMNNERIELLKEWEITGAGRKTQPDWESILSYEKKIGDPTLWNVLLADRRIFFGRYCKQKQDYTPRFNYEQMGGILNVALIRIDEFISRIQPDLILGFGTATFGDYLIYLFARARNIPYLQLKATKIGNNVALNDTAVGLSSHTEKLYLEQDALPEEIKRKAQEFLESVARKGVKYEGAILPGRSRMAKRLIAAPVYISGGIYGAIKIFLDPELRYDNHLPGTFVPALYHNLFQPLKLIVAETRLRRNKKYITREKLPEAGDFVFYPLHFEPEVSLQVFGRPYQNQIELIRNLSLSVPVGMKIVVKEHPRSFGFRPYSYYRKLMEMPNVFLIDPFVPVTEIVHYSKLVAVVSGTIAFEAAISRKPVITFGKVAYNILPETMVRQITDLNRLGYEILDIINNYSYDQKALEKYVGAIIMGAVPVDLYTVLLNKEGRYSEKKKGISKDELRLQDYERLSLYFLKRINEVMQRDIP